MLSPKHAITGNPSRQRALLSLLGLPCAFALTGAPALAAGTQAGTVIQNDVSVGYTVSGVSQTAQTASTTVTVDRKVNMTITRSNGSAIVVAPKQVRAVTPFRLDNLSNDTLDFVVAASQLSGGGSAFGVGTDNFDVTGPAVYQDNGSGSYEFGVDQLITHVDELAPDAFTLLFIVADVPDGRATGDVASVRLTATAAEGNGVGSAGAVLSQTSGANTAGKDTVFADGAGSGDSANDGQFAEINDYRVTTAALTIAKSSTVISDPVNLTTTPKAIPGAIVEFCVAISNAAGGSSATGLTVNSPIAAEMTFVPGSIRLNGADCQSGSAGGSFDAGTTTVSGTLNDLAPGNTLTLIYRAEVK